MKEFCFFGRGGQGVIKSVQIIVQSIVEEGSYAHFIPSFGVERKGSPVYGFFRMDDKEIRIKSQVYEPEAVIIYDDSLMNLPNIFSGFKDRGIVLINTTKNLSRLKEMSLPDRAANVYTVDATSIALNTLKLAIPNTTMLGAYAKVIGGVGWETLKNNIEKVFGTANANAAQAGYDTVEQIKG